MKTYLLTALFLVFSLSFLAANQSEEKTYIIEIESSNLNSCSIYWHRTDGSSDKDNDLPYTLYHGEYGIKGFERGKGFSFTSTWNGWWFKDLIPDTEYSLFIRKDSDSEDSPVWFEEYNFRTIACNTEISNIQEQMMYINSWSIKDLFEVQITCDDVAVDLYELEYGVKGFENGSGTTITSTGRWFYLNSKNLQSNTEYDYYMRAKCNDVYGEWSEKKSFVTTDVFHYVGSEAYEVRFKNITNKSALAEWRKIPGGPPKSYLIEYGPKGFERGKGKTKSQIHPSIELSELEPDTEYSFFVRSNFTSSTDPVWFIEHTFKTYPCNTEISGIKIEEMWTTCFCHNGAVGMAIRWDDLADSYELEYGLKGFQKGTGKTIETRRINDIFIPSDYLSSHTDYDFYIRTKCNDEFGEWTSVNSFSTPRLHNLANIKNVQNSNFEIFPNPVEDILYINFNSTFDLANVNIYIFDLTGLVKYKFEYQENYDLSLLPTGTYIVRVRDTKLSETMLIHKK